VHESEPSVFLVARPSLDWGEIRRYLGLVGGEDWANRVEPIGLDGEAIVEFAGRLCYRSWEPGLNANVTKVRTDRSAYLRNILKSHHGSVIEHAQYSFVFHDVSRVFTHELVRHRAGVAISQESLRYVRLTDIKFRVPEVLDPIKPEIVQIVESLEEFQRSAAERFGLDREGTPFHIKKEVTSALRRLAPLGLSTGMLWSANVRTIRHVIEMRTDIGAEEEIRYVFDKVAELMMHECPLLFQDYARNSDGQWTPEFRKV
jgi:thymidylate synthase, flavin-dependent